MKKEWTLWHLDCAHCAKKIEDAVARLPQVTSARVKFVQKTLTVQGEELSADVEREIRKTIRKISPAVKLMPREDNAAQTEKKGELWRIFLSLFLMLTALLAAEKFPHTASFLYYLPAYVLAGFPVLKKALTGLFHGRLFDENFLMTVATLAAFALTEGREAVTVMLLYAVGEYFQGRAVSKSRRSISALMDIRPDHAHLLSGEDERLVRPEEVPVGALVRVRPGEKIPLDGMVIEGESFLDTSALTGEAAPLSIQNGSEVLSGCINMRGVLTVKVTKQYAESTAAKILELMENAEEGKSRTERFITRFAKIYTPVVVFLALALAVIPLLFGGDAALWVRKAVTCLVISCPCALVISIPLSFSGGIGSAGRRGILIKGAAAVESLSKAHACLFDKTGTVSYGDFVVTAIHPEMISSEALLELAVTGEHYSDHPISLSLKAAYSREIDPARIGKIEEIGGEGVIAQIDGKSIYVGNDRLMRRAEAEMVPCKKCHGSASVVHLAMENIYLGHIVISDRLRDDAKKAVSELKQLGVEDIRLLSGDSTAAVAACAKELQIENYLAKALPADKVAYLEATEKSTAGTVLYVGDGINDAPVLARAQCGIAMGGIGTDAAVEAADVVLMHDSPSKVAEAIRIAKKTMRIVWQNVLFSVGIKLFVLIPTLFSGEEAVPLWFAIFADVGVCLLAILNSLRALTAPRPPKA